MDYCHPCRRHLNGALACPGCGTPAEACRQYAEAVAAQEAADGSGEAYDEETEYAQGDRRGRGGRASARARRRRRRRTLLITAGVVLAVGGLSLAELASEAPGDSTTSAAPDSAAGDAMDDLPTAASTAESIGGEVGSGADSADAEPSSASPSASASEKGKKKKKDEEDKAGEDQSGSESGSSAPAATPSSQGSTMTGPPASAPRPTASAPTPDPEPSETCTRFLWWCA
jgi:hypothetical protein